MIWAPLISFSPWRAVRVRVKRLGPHHDDDGYPSPPTSILSLSLLTLVPTKSTRGSRKSRSIVPPPIDFNDVYRVEFKFHFHSSPSINIIMIIFLKIYMNDLEKREIRVAVKSLVLGFSNRSCCAADRFGPKTWGWIIMYFQALRHLWGSVVSARDLPIL